MVNFCKGCYQDVNIFHDVSLFDFYKNGSRDDRIGGFQTNRSCSSKNIKVFCNNIMTEILFIISYISHVKHFKWVI